MRKLLLVARKEIFLRFTDPIVLLLTIAMPLAIALLVELAFGEFVLGRGIPDTSIPVGIVNQDEASPLGNLGEALEQAIMAPSTDTSPLLSDSPLKLFDVREVEDETLARRMVEREDLIAALFIPPEFSQALWRTGATIHLYINGRSDIRGAAFQSVVEAVANRISARNVTLLTAVKGFITHPRTRAQLASGVLNDTLADLALAAAMPESNPIRVERIRVGQAPQITLAHYLIAAIAIVFTGFTALVGSASILQEQAQSTLQRMLTTPTRLGIILGGKAVGAYINGLIQWGFLIAGVSVIEWLLRIDPGRDARLDPLGLLMLILSVGVASTGIGTAIAGFAKTYAQAANYGRALLTLMGVVGGVFFPIDLFPDRVRILSRVTLHYWAMDGYVTLATGGLASDIVWNVVVLVIMGALFFGAGTWFLQRRTRFG